MKKVLPIVFLVVAMTLILGGCAGMQSKPTAANFKAPAVVLNSIQPSYWEGFWHYGKAEVEKGKAPTFGGSSPMTLEFVFEITNPNPFPVLQESSQFFLFFEGYDLRVVNDNNPMWIPAGKTNFKSMHVTLTATTTWAKFLLAGKELAAQRGDDPWKKVEEWWTKIPDMAFPIELKDGNFTFMADSIVKVVPINIKYP